MYQGQCQRFFLVPAADFTIETRLLQAIRDGSLLRHSAVTFGEVLTGLIGGVSVATILGYLLAKFPPVERLLAPYIVASQSIPIVAIAPLLIIWFGPGTFSKVLICALIVFFPVLINTIVGLHTVPEVQYDGRYHMYDNSLSAIYTLCDGKTIAGVLAAHGVKASFFFTGDFYRNHAFALLIRRLRADGHYLGAHSDKHLLYASWEKRDSTLVGERMFRNDLRNNYTAMAPFGITRHDAPFFLPAFEWYNDSISAWTRREGLTLVNFTPGTSSNADLEAEVVDIGRRIDVIEAVKNRRQPDSPLAVLDDVSRPAKYRA